MAGHFDEMVEAAATALWADNSSKPWADLDDVTRDRYRRKVRIVMRVFRDAHRTGAERDGRAPNHLDKHVQHLLLEVLA